MCSDTDSVKSLFPRQPNNQKQPFTVLLTSSPPSSLESRDAPRASALNLQSRSKKQRYTNFISICGSWISGKKGRWCHKARVTERPLTTRLYLILTCHSRQSSAVTTNIKNVLLYFTRETKGRNQTGLWWCSWLSWQTVCLVASIYFFSDLKLSCFIAHNLKYLKIYWEL